MGHALWVTFALFGATTTILFGIIYLASSVVGIDKEVFSTPLGLLILFALQFIFALAVTSLLPLFNAKWQFSALRQTFGVARGFAWRDFYLPFLLFPLYFIASASVVLVIGQLFPSVNLDQAQDVGFKVDNLTNVFEYVLAFIALVILAPIAEELLFRGYLFGKTRPLIGAVSAALLTSVTFGAIHGQLNVGIDTFILSLFLCLLRYKTDAVWAGMILHALKNLIAYSLLFIAPLLGFNLLQ